MTTDRPDSVPETLRVADLVAKTARVTLKDTIRVALALEAIGALYGEEALNYVLHNYEATRPTPDNVAACEQASFLLTEGKVMNRAVIDAILAKLHALQ